MEKTVIITVRGRVQGVGFRPFIFELATELYLKGTVQNNMDGVKIYVTDTSETIDLFMELIEQRNPRLAKIESIEMEETTFQHFSYFSIIKSSNEGAATLVIPIDASICEDCLQDIQDPSNFRYEYEFTNCTGCGPRYTIITGLPYDRHYTTMNDFIMCENCGAEYEDKTNRRHHAQPIACPTCGPQLSFLNSNGVIQEGNPLLNAINQLQQGNIIAIKGLGGFHLVCDATNEEVVQKLRERKNRPHRPLAIMAKNVDECQKIAHINEEEAKLLQSPESPIVVLQKKKNALAPSIAPNIKTIGIMLPYTPLHFLLFSKSTLSSLVMTSANRSGLPMVYDDKDLSQLDSVVDFVLTHNRKIAHPIDDSVVRAKELEFFRRARGYAPEPFTTTHNVDGIVAFGGQQKNTFAVGRGNQIFVGPHIGELGSQEMLQHFEEEYQHLQKWLTTKEEVTVIDFHPNYMNQELIRGEVIKVQHHHAHMAACMEDNQLDKDCFSVILDGTGYGLDGCIWGFEVFYGNFNEFERLAHLQYTPLPGGEKAIIYPWRNAIGMLVSLLGEEGYTFAKKRFARYAQDIEMLTKMIEKNIHSPLAGTCGRLFDAISAILGVCENSSYDGQAAIELGDLVELEKIYDPYCFEIHVEKETMILKHQQVLLGVIQDIENNVEKSEIAGKFHETIVQMVMTALMHWKKKRQSNKVVLSGGSMHNSYLKKRLKEQCLEQGFDVYTHKKVPCNDGGISLGQLIVASKKRGC